MGRKPMIKCTFENGHEALLRHVTVAAIIERDGKILFEKRAIDLVEGGKLCLPGGYAERDETLDQTVKREVLEETGFEPVSVRFLMYNDKPLEGENHRQNVVFVYVVEVTGEQGEHDQESSEFLWYPLDKLPPESEVAFSHLEYVELYKLRQNGKIA